MVPHQDVAVQAVSVAMGLVAGVGNPVVVVGGAHFMRVAVFQGPADADDKESRVFLQNHGFAALPREVGIHRQQFFRMQEREFFRQIGIARSA